MAIRVQIALRRAVPIGIACLLLFLCSLGQAEAQGNPCAYQPINLERYGMQPFVAAPELRAGVDKIELNVQYSSGTQIAGCRVQLRSYNGALVGPTLRAKPGDTLDLTVTNRLGSGPIQEIPCDRAEAQAGDMHMMMAGPEVYDITNLHTHGLHVSPSGCQDNVFLEIKPDWAVHYQIKIPTDQPPGTFWYHAHLHGSTSVQVSSSMAGAIIIDGGLDNAPSLRDPTANQKIFLLQQIAYNEEGKIPGLPLLPGVGWAKSQRVITVNGQIAPKFEMVPGAIQRWRFIHGGVQEPINLYVEDSRTGARSPLYEIATDGLALGRLDRWQVLQPDPGYRSDVLFQAPLREGRYYLYSGALSVQKTLEFMDRVPGITPTAAEPRQIVAVIEVKGQGVPMRLPTDAELAQYVPYKPIDRSELTGKPQRTVLDLGLAVCSDRVEPCVQPCPEPRTPECKFHYMIDRYEYPNIPVRQLKLNTASEWTLSVPDRQAHPFHIHVNAFQITRPGPTGADEIVWKDTLMVRDDKTMPLKYRLIRSRYEDFTGKFVLHCHILPHEDLGMMQAVEIVN